MLLIYIYILYVYYILMDSGYIVDKVNCFKTLILLRASASPKKS